MIEFLQPIQPYWIDISTSSVLLGALFLYFGKLIGDTKVEKYDKLSYYIEGLLFSIFFVFLPFIFALYFINHNIVFSSFLFRMIIQLTFLTCLYWNIIAQEFLRKHGLLEEFKRRLRNEIEKRKAENSITGWASRKEAWFKKTFGLNFIELNILAFYEIPIKAFKNKLLLFLFSFVTIWITLSMIKINANIIDLTISLIFAFMIFTMLALAYGFGNAYYPFGTIHLKQSNTIIRGKILKFGDFIYVLNRNKKMFVNSSEVSFVEENLFKENNDYERKRGKQK